jgi:hypothetical protein
VARSTAALALARLRSAGFLDWTRRGVTVLRRIRGAEAGLLFAQVSNAYRLTKVPPQVPAPAPAAPEVPRTSESGCRTETTFLNRIRTLEVSNAEAQRDSCSLEAALARLGSAIRAREALGRSMAADEREGGPGHAERGSVGLWRPRQCDQEPGATGRPVAVDVCPALTSTSESASRVTSTKRPSATFPPPWLR